MQRKIVYKCDCGQYFYGCDFLNSFSGKSCICHAKVFRHVKSASKETLNAFFTEEKELFLVDEKIFEENSNFV